MHSRTKNHHDVFGIASDRLGALLGLALALGACGGELDSPEPQLHVGAVAPVWSAATERAGSCDAQLILVRTQVGSLPSAQGGGQVRLLVRVETWIELADATLDLIGTPGIGLPPGLPRPVAIEPGVPLELDFELQLPPGTAHHDLIVRVMGRKGSQPAGGGAVLRMTLGEAASLDPPLTPRGADLLRVVALDDPLRRTNR